MDSVLTSVKKVLGITEEYEQFDQDLIIHINTVFLILNQLGVGTKEPFYISDKTASWSDFVESKNIEAVKTYVALKVRLIFDPPSSSAHVTAIEETIKELEWRLKLQAEPNDE